MKNTTKADEMNTITIVIIVIIADDEVTLWINSNVDP